MLVGSYSIVVASLPSGVVTISIGYDPLEDLRDTYRMI